MKLLKTIRVVAAVVAAAATLALVAPVAPAHAETMTEILARHDAKKAAEAAAQQAQADAARAAALAQPRPSAGEPTLPGNPTIILDRPLAPVLTPEESLALQLPGIIAAEAQVRRIHSGTLVNYWYDDMLVLHRVWDGPEGRWHEANGFFQKVEA
jgi:hypothetical protein